MCGVIWSSCPSRREAAPRRRSRVTRATSSCWRSRSKRERSCVRARLDDREPVEPVRGRVVRERHVVVLHVVATVALATGSTDRRRRRRRRCRRAGRALRPRRLSVAGCARRRRCRCTPARAPRRRARASSAPPSTSAREMGDRSIVIPPPVVRTDAGGTLSSPARTCGTAAPPAVNRLRASVSGGDPPITSQRACARAHRAAPAPSRHGCARTCQPGRLPRAARGAARGVLLPRRCRTCRSPATCSRTSSSTTGARSGSRTGLIGECHAARLGRSRIELENRLMLRDGTVAVEGRAVLVAWDEDARRARPLTDDRARRAATPATLRARRRWTDLTEPPASSRRPTA